MDPAQPDAVDDLLRVTESSIGPVLSGIVERCEIPRRDSSEYDLMIRFIYDMHLRSTSTRAALMDKGRDEVTVMKTESWYTENQEKIESMLGSWSTGNVRQRYLAELFRMQAGDIKSLSKESQRVLHRQIFEVDHEYVIKHISNRHWRLLIGAGGASSLVFSDEAVIVHAENGRVRTGIKHARSRITLPISPTVALQGCFSPISRQVCEVPPQIFRQINGLSVRSAYSEVFSSQPDFEWNHFAGRIHGAAEWMAGGELATWPSNPQQR